MRALSIFQVIFPKDIRTRLEYCCSHRSRQPNRTSHGKVGLVLLSNSTTVPASPRVLEHRSVQKCRRPMLTAQARSQPPSVYKSMIGQPVLRLGLIKPVHCVGCSIGNAVARLPYSLSTSNRLLRTWAMTGLVTASPFSSNENEP